MSMDEAEENLSSQPTLFLRIQNSYMVNAAKLEQVSAGFVVMYDGTELGISRAYARSTIKRYSAYYNSYMHK